MSEFFEAPVEGAGIQIIEVLPRAGHQMQFVARRSNIWGEHFPGGFRVRCNSKEAGPATLVQHLWGTKIIGEPKPYTPLTMTPQIAGILAEAARAQEKSPMAADVMRRLAAELGRNQLQPSLVITLKDGDVANVSTLDGRDIAFIVQKEGDPFLDFEEQVYTNDAAYPSLAEWLKDELGL